MNTEPSTSLIELGVYPQFRFESSLSVFFPAYDDADSLPLLLRRTFATLRRFVSDFEVIVVNDGSRDGTAAILKELEEYYEPHLRIITHPHNLGYGAALRTGFQAATKDYVFYTDGDGQYDPRDLELLLRAAGPGTGLVNGYKIARNDPWHRVAIGWLYNRFARWVFRIKLRDIDCDFRLIRRSAFDPARLSSTSGTICVELVRNLELSGTKVVEVPLRHYARQHGRSQFFRLRSLLRTFLQLCRIFWSLVIAPSLEPRSDAYRSPSHRKIVLVAVGVTLLSFLAYARALGLPFISDDYVQIQLGRDYGPVSRWGALAQDALYRCRATSIVMTYWMERAFGADPFYFRLTGLFLHIGNALLVLALGIWRPVGWRISAIAACFFAVSQRHSEAVIWFAAVPELLVFGFVFGGLLSWIKWLQHDWAQPKFYVLALVSYALALLSKESAVAMVPLCALAIAFHPGRPWKRLFALAPFAIMAAGYFGLAFAARDAHLHFNDGTFSLKAPVFEVILRSASGLLWVWGFVALAGLVAGVVRPWPKLFTLGLVWIVLALLPYSFLTYMVRVPSRHTYLASVGLALIVATAFLSLQRSSVTKRFPWLPLAAVLLIVVHECGYLWTVLNYRYTLRAEPTEKVLRTANRGAGTIYANCFPYSPLVAEYALMIAVPGKQPAFRVGPEAAKQPTAQDFCNAVTIGTKY